MRSRQAHHATSPHALSASTVLLLAGAALLLLASVWIVVASRRGQRPVVTPAPPIAIITASLAASPIVTPATPTALVPTTLPTIALTAAPATPLLSTITPRPRLPTPTARQPNAALSGCALVLPPGFREEAAGYYPATDGSGYVALDRFDPPASQRPLADLTATFVQATISHTVRDFRQTAAVPTGDGYRLDFAASSAGRPGKGSFYVKRFGTAACGVTLFLVDGSALQTPTVLDLLILSLQSAVPTR